MARTKDKPSISPKDRGRKLASRALPTKTQAYRQGRRGRNRVTAASHRMRKKEMEDNLVQQEKQLRTRHEELKKSVEEMKSIRLGFKDLLMSHFMCGFAPIDNFYLRCAQSTTAGDWMMSNVASPVESVVSEKAPRKQTSNAKRKAQANSEATSPADFATPGCEASQRPLPRPATQKSPAPSTPTMSECSEPNNYWRTTTPTQLSDCWDASNLIPSTHEPAKDVSAGAPCHIPQSCLSMPQYSDAQTYDPVVSASSRSAQEWHSELDSGTEMVSKPSKTVDNTDMIDLYSFPSATSFDDSPIFNAFDLPTDAGTGKPRCYSEAVIGAGWTPLFAMSDYEAFGSNIAYSNCFG